MQLRNIVGMFCVCILVCIFIQLIILGLFECVAAKHPVEVLFQREVVELFLTVSIHGDYIFSLVCFQVIP